MRLIELLKNPTDDGVPASIYDDLTGLYGNVVSGSEAKVSELSAIIQGYESEISKLKAMNYDLLVSSAGDNQTADNTADDDTEPGGIDSLFE